MKAIKNIAPLKSLLAEHLEWQDTENIYDWEALERAFMTYIEQLMLHDTEKLIQAMYRIDVDETAFREAFQAQDAYKIAQLILKRELQKVAFREKYK